MIVTAATLLTGDGKTVLQNSGLRYDETGRITEVGPAAQLMANHPGEEAQDYGEASLLPGLFDMHVHLGFYYSQPDKPLYDDYLIALYAMQMAQKGLHLGITTQRDLSSPHGLCRQLRLAGEKGFCTLPRIIHTDTGICMSGGHGHEDGIEEADGPWNIRAAIRRQLRDGADWIKILTSHRSHIPEYTQEELNAATDECHRRGVKAAVHAGCHPAIEMCIEAGFDTIEHGTFLTVAQAEAMAKKGIAWTPTIYAYTYLYQREVQDTPGGQTPPENSFYKKAAAAYKENFKALYDTGVTTLAGSDMVLHDAPPLPLAQELGLMVEYGLSPVQAIQTATQNPAKVLGLAEVTGELRPGLTADLAIYTGDVSQDIEALRKPLAVYLGGQKVFAQR